MRKIVDAFSKAAQAAFGGREESSDFVDPGKLVDDELELVLIRKFFGNSGSGDLPTYRFKMVHTGDDEEIGRIDLRAGNTERVLLYLGHIGYRVDPKYRGKHYAARSTSLLLPLARQHGLRTLWITSNPDNAPSRRTCEMLGAELVEIVDVPNKSDFYRAGEKQKCRYRLDL